MTREELRNTFKHDNPRDDLFTIFHVKWLEDLLLSGHNQENEQLRKEMGVLIESPDSPEANVIRVQWAFAQEVKKQFDTGSPADIPKLMGLVGEMMYPDQKKKALWPLPETMAQMKTLLVKFFHFIGEAKVTPDIDPYYYINEFLVQLEKEKENE